MATGEGDKDCDSHVSCSICFELYDNDGRPPSYLQCFHSFCTPCLTNLAESARARNTQETQLKQVERSVAEQGSGEADDTTAPAHDHLLPDLPYPTPLPPGGVSQLQTSLYMPVEPGKEKGPPPVLCDLCEEGAEAKHTCPTCLACYCPRCRRAHDKLCKPKPVPDSQASAFTGFGRSSGTSDLHDDLQALCSSLMARVQQQQQPLEKPSAGGQTDILPQAQGMSADAAGMKDVFSVLSRLTDRLTQTERLVAVMQTQNTLMVRDLASAHDQNSQLRVDVTRLRSDLTSLRDDYRLAQRENVSAKDKTAIVCQENQQLRYDLNQVQATHAATINDISTIRNDLMNVQNDLTKCQANLAKQETAHSEIKSANTKIKNDVAQIHTEQREQQIILTEIKSNQSALQQGQKHGDAGLSNLNTDMANLQKNLPSLQKELTNLQAKQTQFETNHSSLQKDLNALQAKQTQLETSQAQMKKDQDKHQTVQGKLEGDVGQLKRQQTVAVQKNTSLGKDLALLQASVKKDSGVLDILGNKLNKMAMPVTFYASSLPGRVIKGTVVFNRVHFNVGGAYDHQSGVFEAPISGVYIFMASCYLPAEGFSTIYDLESGTWRNDHRKMASHEPRNPFCHSSHCCASAHRSESVGKELARTYTTVAKWFKSIVYRNARSS